MRCASGLLGVDHYFKLLQVATAVLDGINSRKSTFGESKLQACPREVYGAAEFPKIVDEASFSLGFDQSPDCSLFGGEGDDRDVNQMTGGVMDDFYSIQHLVRRGRCRSLAIHD